MGEQYISNEQFLIGLNQQIKQGNMASVICEVNSDTSQAEIKTIRNMTKKLGIGFKHLSILSMSEQDLVGIPKMVRNTKWVIMEPQAELPTPKDGNRGILLITEAYTCINTVRRSLTELAVNRRMSMNNYTLPPGWKIVIVANNQDIYELDYEMVANSIYCKVAN